MPTFDEVATFVRKETYTRTPLAEATTLQSDIGLSGDDMDDLLAAYAKRFNVDLSSYLWYFHTGEEGAIVGPFFFAPPSDRHREIPISVGMLHQFAEAGRWGVEYPPHDPPTRPYDIWFSWALLAVMLACMAACMLR